MPPTLIHPRSAARPQLVLVLRALLYALRAIVHPRMLWLCLWPWLVSLVLWAILGLYFASQATNFLHQLLFEWRITQMVESAMTAMGLASLLFPLVPIVYAVLLFAASVMTSLLIVGVFSMPTVTSFVAYRKHSELMARGETGFLASLLNGLVTLLVCACGWLLTMPLWLIAPLALLLPWFWWTCLITRVFRYDALARYASQNERAWLIAQYRGPWIVLGAICAALNFVPLLALISPVFSALVFSYFGLHALELHRMQSAEPVDPTFPDMRGGV